MNRLNLKIICLFFILTLSGCVPVPNSPSPRFYMLQAMDKHGPDKKFEVAAGLTIGIGPINIPQYLNRPQIVTRDKDNLLNIAQFQRWGEPLDIALERLINENFIIMLPGANVEMYPWNLFIPVKYQITADIIQLDGRLDKDLLFVAQWSVIDLKNNKLAMTKRSEFSQPIATRNYAGLAQSLSAAAAALSSEMAEAIVELESRTGIKDNP